MCYVLEEHWSMLGLIKEDNSRTFAKYTLLRREEMSTDNGRLHRIKHVIGARSEEVAKHLSETTK